jgi:hypothetical protein
MCVPHRPQPAPRKITVNDVKRSIQQAQNLCYNFEDTPSCRVAWDRVEELTKALARQREKELLKKNLDEMCLEDPDACKEYDV